MKRTNRRVLSILLCLCMVLTLLPMSALAAWTDELTPETAPVVDGDAPKLLEEETALVPDGSADLAAAALTDGITNDTWKVENSVNGTTCQLVDGKGRELYAGASNGNSTSGDGMPAMFVNETASAALAAASGEKYVEIKFEPVSGSGVSRFGVYINYTNPANGFFLGYDSGSKWYYQLYSGGNGTYASAGGANAWTPGEDMTLKLVWSGSTMNAYLNGSQILTNLNISSASSTGTKVAIKCGGYQNEDTNRTHVYIKEMHYTGQSTVTVYNVNGTVTSGGSPVEGATVSIGDKSTTTAANGTYTLSEVPGGAATLTVTKTGYNAVTESLNLTADLTKNINLTAMPVISGKVTLTDAPTQGVPGVTVGFYQGETLVASAVTDVNGDYSAFVPAGTYTVSVTGAGYATVTETGYAVSANATKNFTTVESLEGYHVLSTSGMEVLLSKEFPQVVEYRMKGSLAGRVMAGQKTPLNTVNINKVAVIPTVTSTKVSDTRVDYTLTVDSSNNNGTGVNAVIKAHFAVGLEDVNKADSVYAANTLGFYIDDVTYPNNDLYEHPLKSIEIPNHSLLSVDSTQPGAGFAGGKSNNTSVTTNDKRYTAAGDTATGYEDFFAGFIFNDGLSAGLSSNSELGGGTAASTNYPVRLTKSHSDAGVETYSLSSTLWYYNYALIDSHPGGDDMHDYDAMIQENAANAVYIPKENERPWVKVVIAGDANQNGKVDWQDGAVALRETVMHIPEHSEMVKEAANIRISMNFGSQAQNPFLIALDNVKRVANHTDGLGQAVLLKGYAGEGHDSNHPDYYDIGQRIGGAADMNTLIQEGKELGAYFGIHVNASELYPEADAMSDAIVRRNTDHSLHYGWNWLDQGIAFSALYDFGTGHRNTRWDRLYDAVGANSETEAGLEFVYVDVWGNNTGGTEDSWQTRRLSNEITGHGWRAAHEWSYANPYDSTFHHWTTDFTYGDYTCKGCMNSEVLRFLLNSYKDAFPPDFATFGGACNAPLLGGPAMQGFEGWQGDAEYDLSIYNTYNQMVATKFLQHYNITEWVNANNAVSIPYAQGAKDALGNWSTRDLTAQWTPEMQITLKSDDGAHTVVVTRGLDENVDATASFSLDNEVEYRSRVITLDGVKILEGAPASAGEDNAFPHSAATLKYLIPWYWDNEGKTVSSADEKLYHWNAQGGESTWTLPANWRSLSNVIVYKLSDQGRDDGTTVQVVDGQITLNAEAETGYVVVRGASNKGPQFTWSTGLHVEDASFNVDTAKGPWTISGSGTAVRTNSVTGISVLKMAGQVAASQTMNSLKPNTKYVAYVAVDNRSEAKATMEVKQGATVIASNYTGKSIAKNYISAYYLHNNRGVDGAESYFQNMYVFFETGDTTSNISLTLRRDAGSGATYWDDVRILETEAVNFSETNGLTTFTQDFEHVAQGVYPFVLSGIEGVADNRQHLSELNAPFTQAGWDVKKMDDVIEGEWSIKINGLAGSNNLAMQTIPQNFHFEPGVTYTVDFDYEMGSEGSFRVAVGDGAYSGADSVVKWVDLEKTLVYQDGSLFTGTGTAKGTVGHASFSVTGSESGQTWVGIFSASAPSYPSGVTLSDSEKNFGGYKDFVLDNLVISQCSAETSELAALVDEAAGMSEANYTSANFDADWAALQSALTSARSVLDNSGSTSAEITAAATALRTAMEALTKVEVAINGTVTGVSGPVADATVTLEDATYIPVEGYTTTTDAQGRYSFTSKTSNPLAAADYKVKVQATGYNVKTVAATGITKENPTATADVTLEAEAAGAYVNDFNGGDVSMMGYLVSDETEGLPTVEATEYNGSGALEITWNSTAMETRHINNVVDKNVSFANGSMSFDVTPLDTDGQRFGITFRGKTGTEKNAPRVFVGQEDSAKKWFVEYWNADGGTGYSSVETKDIGLVQGVTRNVRVTMNGTTFAVYIDGVEIYNVTYAVDTTAGWAGFNMRGNSGTREIIDNLRIVSTDPAPAGTHTVSGTVTDGTNPIAGITVHVLNSQGEAVTSTTTNAAGQYKTPALEPGSYTFKVSGDFYAEKTQSITVASADLTDQDLVLTVNGKKLQDLVDANKSLSNANGTYTAESWQTFTAALAAAQTALAESPLSAASLTAAYQGLKSAVDGLEIVGGDDSTNFQALREAYNKAGKLTKPSNVNEEKWAALQTALADAYAVLSNADATQAEVDAATEALNAAYKAVTNSGGNQGGSSSSGSSGGAPVGGGGGGNTVATKIDQNTGNIAYTVTTPEGTQGVTEITLEGKMTATVTLSGKEAGVVEAPVSPLPVDGSTVTFQTKKDAGSATVSIPLAGAKPGVVAVVVKEDGTEEVLPKTIVDGNALLMMVDGNITVRLEDRTPDFTDVSKDHWAKDAVAFSASRDLFKGTGDNEFSPNMPMNRAMLVTVLYRMEQEPEAAMPTFSDVAADAWYAQAVGWADASGIAKGTGAGFAPDSNLTRETMALMLYRYAKNLNADLATVSEAELTYFADSAAVSPWAQEAMAWAVRTGILNGKNGTHLDPVGTATRAEVATMLMRMVKALNQANAAAR